MVGRTGCPIFAWISDTRSFGIISRILITYIVDKSDHKVSGEALLHDFTHEHHLLLSIHVQKEADLVKVVWYLLFFEPENHTEQHLPKAPIRETLSNR